MDPYETHMQRIADVTRESNFALWNALLTFNGVIVGVFSAVAVFQQETKLLAFFIVLLSMISSALLIQNFRTTRDVYLSMGQTAPEDILRMSEDEKRRQIASSAQKHKASGSRERLTYWILTAQAIAILALVYWKQ